MFQKHLATEIRSYFIASLKREGDILFQLQHWWRSALGLVSLKKFPPLLLSN
jgi:hypothetical protein